MFNRLYVGGIHCRLNWFHVDCRGLSARIFIFVEAKSHKEYFYAFVCRRGLKSICRLPALLLSRLFARQP